MWCSKSGRCQRHYANACWRLPRESTTDLSSLALLELNYLRLAIICCPHNASLLSAHLHWSLSPFHPCIFHQNQSIHTVYESANYRPSILTRRGEWSWHVSPWWLPLVDTHIPNESRLERRAISLTQRKVPTIYLLWFIPLFDVQICHCKCPSLMLPWFPPYRRSLRCTHKCNLLYYRLYSRKKGEEGSVKRQPSMANFALPKWSPDSFCPNSPKYIQAFLHAHIAIQRHSQRLSRALACSRKQQTP